MHVGVLLPIFNTDAQKGKRLADHLLTQNRWCWSDDCCNEEGEFDEEIDAVVNQDAMWDYPYYIADKWYDGQDEQTTLYPGITIAELKENYIKPGYIGVHNLTELFTFIYQVDLDVMEMASAQDILDYLNDLPDTTRLYVGIVHI